MQKNVELKKRIFEMSNDPNLDLDEYLKCIKQYEESCPFDMDIFLIKMDYYYKIGELGEAIKIGRNGLEKYPYSVILHETYASVCEEQGSYLEAYKHYRIAQVINLLHDNEEKAIVNDEKIDGIVEILNELIPKLDEFLTKEEKNTFIEEYNQMRIDEDTYFGFVEGRFRGNIKTVGDYFYADHTRWYLGAVKALSFEMSEEKSLRMLRGEFMMADTLDECSIPSGDYLVPVAVGDKGTTLEIQTGNDVVNALQNWKGVYYYYRINGPATIKTKGTAYFAKPILMSRDKKRKRLVLNLFIDGLAQMIIRGDKFEQYMPNTYRFFSKGVIFDRAYCTGDWTLPSIGSYMTSRYTFDHRLFHNKLDGNFPKDMTTLAQFFQKMGYHTTLFTGDWRTIPSYGSSRGFDRTVYQHMNYGYRADEVIADLIEQLDAFGETDQFIWATIGDLHNVADRIPCSISDQCYTDIKDRAFSGSGETSVKLVYSEEMINQYISVLKFIDRKLELLFHSIEKRYKDDEVVVSIFSDHGQGYLIPEGDEFFSEPRANVAFMVRDSRSEKIVCNDLVSAVDYLPMMCDICNVPYEKDLIEGRTPEVFCGEGRKEALTESIHPGDPYQAVIHFEEGVFHYISQSIVQPDGRFLPGEYKNYIKSYDGRIMDDPERTEYYTEMIHKHIAPMLIY